MIKQKLMKVYSYRRSASHMSSVNENETSCCLSTSNLIFIAKKITPFKFFNKNLIKTRKKNGLKQDNIFHSPFYRSIYNGKGVLFLILILLRYRNKSKGFQQLCSTQKINETKILTVSMKTSSDLVNVSLNF